MFSIRPQRAQARGDWRVSLTAHRFQSAAVNLLFCGLVGRIHTASVMPSRETRASLVKANTIRAVSVALGEQTESRHNIRGRLLAREVVAPATHAHHLRHESIVPPERLEHHGRTNRRTLFELGSWVEFVLHQKDG